jgi:putative transposase
MNLAHKIRLNPTTEQEALFRQFAGTARFTWNWALAEWNELYEEYGINPNIHNLKRYFNTIKYEKFPWMKQIARDPHAEPFAHLGQAWGSYFKDIRQGKEAFQPTFKKKGKSKDSFYIANDQFWIEEKIVKLPKIGWVSLTESLRFKGKIMSGTVSRTANHWYLSVQVELNEEDYYLNRTHHLTTGVDLGVKHAVVLANKTTWDSPKPHKKLLRRIKIRQRRYNRKYELKKKEIGLKGSNIKGTHIEPSNNMKKDLARIAKSYERISNIRKDFINKLTTQICKNHTNIVIEDLNVKGMLKNHKLARAISEIGFYEIRRQLTYKSQRYQSNLIIADRWFPSSKLCSCGTKNESLTLKDRSWTCSTCGRTHDRDNRAAKNLKGLAYLQDLPVAKEFSNEFLVFEDSRISNRYGKVTSTRYDKATKVYQSRKESVVSIN